MSKQGSSSRWGGLAAPRPRPLHVDWLVGDHGPLIDAPGRVGLSSCPGRADLGGDVERDVRHLASLGVRVVVSLVAEAEMEMYGAAGLRQTVESVGLVSLSFPLEDTQPPASLPATYKLCRRVLCWLGEGESVLIHCIGGWGRSGTLAASLLTHQGYDPQRAIGLVRKARSPRCVESKVQELFVAEYAREQARRPRYYYLTTQADLQASGQLIGSGACARALQRGAVASEQLLDSEAVGQAAQGRLGESGLLILSGEPAEESGRDHPIDRAFLLEGPRWRAIALGELFR